MTNIKIKAAILVGGAIVVNLSVASANAKADLANPLSGDRNEMVPIHLATDSSAAVYNFTVFERKQEHPAPPVHLKYLGPKCEW